MRRHHYLYGRTRYLTDPQILEALGVWHRELAAAQARTIGLLDPDGPGSWTHPDLSRMLHADGKVVTPLFKAQPGTAGWIRRPESSAPPGPSPTRRCTSRVTVRPPGVPSSFLWPLAARPSTVASSSTSPGSRPTAAKPRPPWTASGGSPLVPGAQGVIYDTALRGVHHQTLLRDLGLLPVNRVTAAKAGVKQARRSDGRRVEKSTRLETRTITLPDGTTRTLELYARGGAVGIGELTERGDLHYVELTRVRTHRNRDKSGTYRWYNDYRLPDHLGAGILTVRLHGTPRTRPGS